MTVEDSIAGLRVNIVGNGWRQFCATTCNSPAAGDPIDNPMRKYAAE